MVLIVEKVISMSCVFLTWCDLSNQLVNLNVFKEKDSKYSLRLEFYLSMIQIYKLSRFTTYRDFPVFCNSILQYCNNKKNLFRVHFQFLYLVRLDFLLSA